MSTKICAPKFTYEVADMHSFAAVDAGCKQMGKRDQVH